MRRKQGARVAAGSLSPGALQAMEGKGDGGYRGDEGKRVFLSDGVLKHKSPMKNGRGRRRGGLGRRLSAPLHLSLVCPRPRCSSSS